MRRFLLLLLALALPALPIHAAYDFPERIVMIEEMQMLVPMEIAVPKVRAKGEVKGPVLVKVHVDDRGFVKNVVLMESCGSPGHDEAALKGMRKVIFKPKLVNGQPVNVTLVVPLHLPKTKTSVD